MFLLLENTFIKAEISRVQVDWLNSLKEELTQVQEDLSFYNNILEEFMTENIISLRLDSRGDIIQESNTIMTTADVVAAMDITVDAVILDDASVAIDSYVGCSNWHE